MTRHALGACVAVLIVVAAAARAEGPVRISYHEPAVGMRFDEPASTTATGKTDGSPRRSLQFSAFGRDFSVDLVRNDRLIAGWLAQAKLVAGVPQVYRGSLHGLPDTWARLTIIDGQPAGAIWDGSELFLIDKASRLGVSAPAPATATVVVRASDVQVPIDVLHFAAKPPGGSVQAGLQKAPSPSAATGAYGLSGAFPVGLVLDTGFVNDFSDPMAYAMAVANVVDGIFVAQLALHIDVEHVETYAFTSTSGDALLEELAELKSGNPYLRRLGLVHLLTRTKLDGDIIGMATIGRVCEDQQGVGLTRASGGITTALIMAHELGHNFGAGHDGEPGSACAATPATYLMAARLSYARTFSPCSIQSMAPVISGAGCKTAIFASDVRLVAPDVAGPAWYGEPLQLNYSVYNAGAESALENLVSFTSNNPDAVVINDMANHYCASISTAGTTTTCDLQSIHAGQAFPIVVHITPGTTETLMIDAAVTAANDADASNNVSTLEVEVLPATDLAAEAAYTGSLPYAQPGWTVPLAAAAANGGDFETSATINVSTDATHRILAPAGCTQDDPYHMRCELGILAPGQRQSVPFDLEVDPGLALDLDQVRQDRIYVEATSTLHDVDAGNDWATLPLKLVGSIHDLDLVFVQAPEGLVAGQARSFQVRVGNNGPDAAADVYLLTNGNGLQFSGWSIGQGTCVAEGVWLNCRIDRLDSGGHVDLSVSYTTSSPDRYPLSTQAYASGGIDTALDNGWQQVDIVVSPASPPQVDAPADSADNGGGGSVSWLELVFSLALVLLLRMRCPAVPAAGAHAAWRGLHPCRRISNGRYSRT